MFHFCFSQCRTAVCTPVHRFGSFMQMTCFNDFAQGTNDVRFKTKIHSEIRIIPFAKYTKTFKIFSLTIHLLVRIFTTGITKNFGINFHASLTYLLLNVQLNRKTMTIPTRHIRRIKTTKRFGFNNDVFEHFINRVTDVNIAIGIRRPIVQNKLFTTSARLAQFGVKPHFSPAL